MARVDSYLVNLQPVLVRAPFKIKRGSPVLQSQCSSSRTCTTIPVHVHYCTSDVHYKLKESNNVFSACADGERFGHYEAYTTREIVRYFIVNVAFIDYGAVVDL